MSDRQERLRQNLDSVRARIALATERAGRPDNSVTLVAVTKYVDQTIIRELVSVGCTDLGESRPQAFWGKAQALDDLDVRWHFIGHLQRNKLKRTLPISDLIHSVDSLRLLRAINEQQKELSSMRRRPVLLEVNISGDDSKHGFSPDTLTEAIELSLTMEHIDLRGLMGMAGYGTSRLEAKGDFAKLSSLRGDMLSQFPGNLLPELSMGMSGDFEEAIAEGATLVRVGSALFEGIGQ